MNQPIISIWSVGKGKDKSWVCQARIRQLGQKPVSVQRRHAIKTVAYERALEAIRLRMEPKNDKTPLLVKDVLIVYLRSLEGTVKDTTIGEYAYQLNRYFCEPLGARDIASITAEEVRTLLKNLLNRGLSVATSNTVRTRISGLFNFAVREQMTVKNPAALVKPFRAEAGKPSLVQKPWNLQETRRALVTSEGDILHLFLTLCIFTGLRRGEAAGLRWGDFSEGEKTLDVKRALVSAKAWHQGQLISGTFMQSPKTHSSIRKIYCCDEVLRAIYKARRKFSEEIGRLPRPEDPMIFRGDGQSFEPCSIGQKFKRFCKSNNIRMIRVHDLRHTSAVMALEAGIPLEAVSEGLGHSGVDITKRIYAPIVPGLGRKFSSQLEHFIVPTVAKKESVLFESSRNA